MTKAAAADHVAFDRSALADQVAASRADLRQAMADTKWSIDALAAAMTASLGREIDRGYLWRLLNNEKPWRDEYTSALPDDLEGRWHQLRAERFGRIVVEPLTGLEAQKALIAGLLGVMAAPAPQLPAKADRLAKAEIVPVARKAAR